ncbi:hypothetical protein [Spirosoma koreense]
MPIKPLFAALFLLVVTLATVRAQTATAQTDTLKTVVGKWSGTYTGDSSGKFELVINQDASQKLAGQVIMLPADGSRYPITLKSISWKNGQLKAAYTDPQEGDDVNFTGTYTNPDLEGTWKADEGQSTGTWQLTRLDP